MSITDFLPFECSACHEVFCLEHRTFKDHNCAASAEKNVRSVVPPPNQLLVSDSLSSAHVACLWGGGACREWCRRVPCVVSSSLSDPGKTSTSR